MLSLEDRVMLLAVTKIRWPGCKKDVFLYVFANHDPRYELGIECSQRTIAEFTGISRTLVRLYLNELVDEKVLERYEGGGPRGHAFRPVLEFDLWRSRWFGAYPDFDRDWPIKQNSAVGDLMLLLAPPIDRKPGSAARPGVPLGVSAARNLARQRRASRADRRATGAPLVGQPFARHAESASADETIPSNSSTNSLTREAVSDAAKQVLGRIQQVQKPGTYVGGSRRLEVVAVVDAVAESGPFLKVINALPLELHALNYADAVIDAAAARAMPEEPPPRPMVPEWREPEYDEPAAPAETAIDQIRQARENLRTRADGAPACETDAGGAAE
jgi:hypothetical protein